MTAVLESTDVSTLSSTELDKALKVLVAEQQNRASIQRVRSDIACGFVLMTRGLKGCQFMDFTDEQQEWRPTTVGRPSLSGAAETFSEAADSLPAGASKLLLQSLTAECYHLIGEHDKATAQAKDALAYQQHPDMGCIVETRLALCRQLAGGKMLTSNSSDQLDSLQDLVLAA